ncbi:MAG: hypothetical protein ACO3F9_12900 [Burkholderiales bacterium]
MRYAFMVLAALSILPATATPARAQVSIGISVPGVTLGINLPAYPELVLVPGYPVYYAPQVRANYFFYDGYYWLYHDDRWYVSDWYNGPWGLVEPDDVPLFVLRVPVRYYLASPAYFHAWYVDAPPLWHVHWGHRWTRHYHGWERWDRRVAYAPAPLPHYQRHYAGQYYPRGEHRRLIRREHYQYRPHDITVRRHDQQRQAARAQSRPVAQGRADFPRAQVAPLRSDEARRPAQTVPQRQLRQIQPPAGRHGQAFSQPRPQVQRAQPSPQQSETVQRPLRTGAVAQPRIPATRSVQPGFRQAEQRPQLRERVQAARSEARQGRGHRERLAEAPIQARTQERGPRHPAQDRAGRRN